MSRQATFVEEYLKDGNATRAATVAGYSNPNSYGTRLLDTKSVQDMLKARAGPVLKKQGYTVEKLSEMAQNLYDKPIAGSERAAAINILAKLHRLIDNEQPQAPNITLNLQVVAPDDVSRETKPVITIEPAE